MDEKGYIQYTIEWRETGPPPRRNVEHLIFWRQRLYSLGLIGVDANGLGFGNISQRRAGGFIISGTQTGDLPDIGPEHFSLVTDYEIESNWLQCEGPVKASSEALSHAILYEADATVGAVIHVHSASDWHRLLNDIPTTAPDAEAGTVRMAEEIGRLFEASALSETRVLAMGGHRDGLISFGRDLDEAGTAITEACAAADVA